MPLRRLAVRNVRSLREIDIDFSRGEDWRHWTVLLGENGTGKSTLLRCIALAMAGSDAIAELFRDPPTWVRNGEEKASIEAEFTTKDGELRQARLEWQVTDSISTVLRRNGENLDQLDRAVAKAARNYFVAAYGSSRRLPAKDSPTLSRGEVFSTRRAQAMATLFSRDAALRPVEAWAMDLEYQRGGRGLDLVRSALNTLLPGVEFAEIDKQRRQLMFHTPDGDVPLEHLSDGYQNMAGWIGDFLFRMTETFADFEQPLDVGGILLLDEVDLHLHPVWQRQLLKFLTERLPNFQFVVTTHSPFTAHQSPPDALHIVERGADQQQRMRQYVGDPRLLRIEQLLDPLLGLPTAESVKTEDLRAEYIRLRDQATRSRDEEARFDEVKQLVADLPQAQAISQEEKDRLALLSRVETLLTNRQ
jgi:predicted ATP-binding protein involved in virulence